MKNVMSATMTTGSVNGTTINSSLSKVDALGTKRGFFCLASDGSGNCRQQALDLPAVLLNIVDRVSKGKARIDYLIKTCNT